MKKIIYILAAMFLGLMLAEIAHWSLEIFFINNIIASGSVPYNYSFLGTHCFLPPYLQFGLILFGLIGGYFTGQAWWRIVYVEHRHWRKK